ncbi:unnamed protein product [Mucor hiemalis]
MDSTTLSIKNASGKTFSLLNDSSNSGHQQRHFQVNKLTTSMTAVSPTRRKYHCTEPGCNKSFTTSGHLARHNRIHTGEKNFHCLHPGCPSRFSRQDNMMQHYRTHLSQKLRRQQLRQQQEEKSSLMKQRPQLYCHAQHGNEDKMLFQPLVIPTTTTTRSRRSVTMPSLPYPPPILNVMATAPTKVINRPRRALSTSSTCSSSSSSSSFSSPPPINHNSVHQHYHHDDYYHYHHRNVGYHHHHQYQSQHKQDHQQNNQDWTPSNSQKSFSSLLHLANIVSTFG